MLLLNATKIKDTFVNKTTAVRGQRYKIHSLFSLLQFLDGSSFSLCSL